MINKLKKIGVGVVTSLLFFSVSNIFAQKGQSLREWLTGVKKEAVETGIDPVFFDGVFKHMQINRRVINLNKNQPEHRLTFEKYKNTRASKVRIAIGKRKYKEYHDQIIAAGNAYGVDPCVILSIWGMETSYGGFMGDFPVIKSLASLAYSHPDEKRAQFFRKELILALHILQSGHVSYENFKGEWAGASGHPQFLPSSWFKYAVDFDNDGKKDIWTDKNDVFASIANYLHKNGWSKGEPWVLGISTPKNFPPEQEGRKVVKKVSTWVKEYGIKSLNGQPVPKEYYDLDASVVFPYGGPNLLVFNNFNTIMKYNRSIYYAGSIGYMADSICQRKDALKGLY